MTELRKYLWASLASDETMGPHLVPYLEKLTHFLSAQPLAPKKPKEDVSKYENDRKSLIFKKLTFL